MDTNACTDKAPTTITIVHFNDVYDIEAGSQEPVGGAARFATAVRRLADRDPLVLFCGDALNPSVMSRVTQGRQMISVLNAIGVHCAMYGNHEFDHGVDNLVELSQESKFPWLLSNIYDDTTDRILADGKAKHVITWHGKKIGFIGLVEEDWLETLSTIDPEDVEYRDFVTEGRNLARELRAEGVDYVIALTHMRWPNDERLAENVDEIDLVLGGHDHDVGLRKVNGRTIVKSGTDFRNYAVVTLTFKNDSVVDVDVQVSDVDSSIPEDEEVKSLVDKYVKSMGEKIDVVLGHIGVDLDGRFKIIRTQESNLGNFITDIMLRSTEADFAMLNAGVLRSDRIHPHGEFKMRDVMEILPFMGSVVVVTVTGNQVLAALENGVSKYPAHEGCFPQVAGISFAFDPKKPSGQRIIPGSVMVGEESLDSVKTYNMCTNDFLAKGKDGYDCLVGCPMIVNEDDGPQLSTIVQNHFQSVSSLKGLHKRKYYHHQSIIPRRVRRMLSTSRRQTAVAQVGEGMSLSQSQREVDVEDGAQSLWKKARIALAFVRHSAIEKAEADEVEVALAPKVQRRIRNPDGGGSE